MMRAILPGVRELAELVRGLFTLGRSFPARWKAGHFAIRLWNESFMPAYRFAAFLILSMMKYIPQNISNQINIIINLN
ncbi:MAG TPA: hypothetical protein VN785_10430 [Candidatus Angelobacter sp.]|nr:hypothetical protein [Candidatus Angelobacter sp.]